MTQLQKNHTKEFQTFKDDADAKFLYFSIQPTIKTKPSEYHKLPLIIAMHIFS